jgi:hypothetical protein
MSYATLSETAACDDYCSFVFDIWCVTHTGLHGEHAMLRRYLKLGLEIVHRLGRGRILKQDQRQATKLALPRSLSGRLCGAQFAALPRKQYEDFGRVIRAANIRHGRRPASPPWANSGRRAHFRLHGKMV